MPGCDSAGAAERSCTTPKARGSSREELPDTGEEQPHIQGAVTPQEIDTDLPVSVQESPAEAWVDSGLP